jgi:hypothetical protein
MIPSRTMPKNPPHWILDCHAHRQQQSVVIASVTFEKGAEVQQGIRKQAAIDQHQSDQQSVDPTVAIEKRMYRPELIMDQRDPESPRPCNSPSAWVASAR